MFIDTSVKIFRRPRGSDSSSEYIAAARDKGHHTIARESAKAIAAGTLGWYNLF
jgi:hypothetical protein